MIINREFLTFHLLVEIKLHVFDSVAFFKLTAAWVDIQVIFLAVKHEPFDGLPTSVAPYYAFWVARFWWLSHESEPRTRKKFMRNRRNPVVSAGFMKIKIALFAPVSWAEPLLLAPIAGVRLHVVLQL